MESIVKDGLIMHRATTLLDKCHKDPINALRNFLRSKENILAFVMETDKILSDHPHLAKNLNGEFHHLNYEFFRKNGEEVQPLLTAKDYQDNGILGVFIKSKKGGTYLSSYMMTRLIRYAFPQKGIEAELNYIYAEQQVQARISLVDGHHYMCSCFKEVFGEDNRALGKSIEIAHKLIVKWVTGLSPSEWEEKNKQLASEGNFRDYATMKQRELIDKCQREYGTLMRFVGLEGLEEHARSEKIHPFIRKLIDKEMDRVLLG